MYRKAGVITIGEYLNSLRKYSSETPDNFVRYGEDYISRYIKDELKSLHIQRITFGAEWVNVLRYFIDTNTNTQWIDVIDGDARCKIRYIVGDNLVDINSESTLIRDACDYIKSFVYIEHIISIGNNAASGLLYKIATEFAGVPIFINAGYLYYGDYVCINESQECFDLLNKLIKYYTLLGFKDVNDVIGCYSECRPMALLDDNLYKWLMLPCQERNKTTCSNKYAKNKKAGGVLSALSLMAGE